MGYKTDFILHVILIPQARVLCLVYMHKHMYKVKKCTKITA